MDKSTKVSKDKGSCLNVAQETHEATFTFGLGGNRPGDEALYNALSAEGKLDFDNENVKYAYNFSTKHTILDNYFQYHV